MNKGLTLISSIGVGAGLMYLFDPDRGNRRRALLRDKTVHGLNKASEALDKTARDLGNRARGLVAEAESLFSSRESSDDALAARVRARLGRVVSHPRAIEVTANQGQVTLSGPVLSSEADDLIECVWSVPGVTEVEDKLEVHQKAGNIPALQGGRARTGERWDVMQAHWSPTTRLFVGALGGGLMAYCLGRRDILSLAMGTVGFGLFARAVTNTEVAQLAGLSGRRAVDIQKTINIAAPVERVFDFWIRQENFPLFMSNVREVRKTGEDRYHWTVAGPAGISVEWDAEITRLTPNELLAWKSLPGSTVEQSGIIHFKPTPKGGTNIDIKMSYNPPTGALGHLVASLFGSDPKSEMNEDLMRMKSFIETGQTPHDAAKKSVAAREAT